MTILDGFPNDSSVGGYPFLYEWADGTISCGDCAKKEEEREKGAVLARIPFYEGSSYECGGGCGELIESAYGEDDE